MEALEDEFGDIIQKARNGNGLTLKDVAEKTHIPFLLLEEMEACRKTPTKEYADSLSRLLGLDPDKLYDIAMQDWHPDESVYDVLPGVIAIDGFVGSYKVRGYILAEREGGEAAAFDTANDSRKIIACLKEWGFQLKYIFLTHGHSDHVGGIEEICHATGAGIGIPESESVPLLEPCVRKKMFHVRNGSEYNIGRSVIRAISTPGHTTGSMSYITPYGCFSGDALFAGSVGRALGVDGYQTLLRSVKTGILSLGEDMRIFPGHGPATTVGEEIRHNPFF